MPQCIYQHLYTPVGLRSISPTDPRYRGRYGGSPAERDGSYHQGPVWGWVLGPYLRARFALGATHEEIYRSLERVEQRLETGCLGTVSEIYDRDPPASQSRRSLAGLVGGGAVVDRVSLARLAARAQRAKQAQREAYVTAMPRAKRNAYLAELLTTGGMLAFGLSAVAVFCSAQSPLAAGRGPARLDGKLPKSASKRRFFLL